MAYCKAELSFTPKTAESDAVYKALVKDGAKDIESLDCPIAREI